MGSTRGQLFRALDSITPDSLAAVSRTVISPADGQSVRITMSAAEWQHVRSLADRCGASVDALCQFAILIGPPEAVLFQSLARAYLMPIEGDDG